MRIKINRLEDGHNSYPLVCRRPAETVLAWFKEQLSTLYYYHITWFKEQLSTLYYYHITWFKEQLLTLYYYHITWFKEQLSTLYYYHIIPVCEIKGSSLMNLLIFYKIVKKLRLV
jgi:hypothetical protein